MKRFLHLFAFSFVSALLFAEDELIKFGDFEQWITRNYKESAVIGGKRKTLLEVGPTSTWP